jgi:hypothetical protein
MRSACRLVATAKHTSYAFTAVPVTPSTAQDRMFSKRDIKDSIVGAVPTRIPQSTGEWKRTIIWMAFTINLLLNVGAPSLLKGLLRWT